MNRGVKVPRLNPKYGYRDKEPMGSYIAYHYINSLFENGIINVTNKSFSKIQYQVNQNNSLYIIVARNLFVSENDIAGMLDYVSNGNIIFISAEYIDEQLLDTIRSEINYDISTFFITNEYTADKKDTWVSLAYDNDRPSDKYGIYFTPFETAFRSYDTLATQVLGYNEKRETNFVAINHGRGKFILHTAPVTFSNYFLLANKNREYLEKVFSYFMPLSNREYSEPVKSVYWDNFYRTGRGTDEPFSIVGFFKKHPPLYFAFIMVLTALLLFISFGGKRKRRYVPDKNPNINTTVSYTQTIGRLYLQKKDNRNIAVKMFTYFLDQVRNQYFLNTQNLNAEFVSALSRKSKVDESRVSHLLLLMEETDRADNISDMRLLEIHNLLQEYFK